MEILLLIVVVFFAVLFWLQYRQSRNDWRQVRMMIDAIAEGRNPRTYILHGCKDRQRIGVGLEALADQRDRLLIQISREGFNLQTILSSMSEGVMVVDRAHEIRLVNAPFLNGFELRNAPLGHTILHALRNAEIDEAMREALGGGKPLTRELMLPTGGYVILNAAPVRDAEGRVLGAAAIFHDITQLKQLEQMRRDFVANVSHELRTPLSIFQGYLEMLLDNPALPQEELVETLQVLKKHSTRLNELVKDLLTLARLESRHGEFEPTLLSLETLLTDATNDWQQKYGDKGVRLCRVASSPLPEVKAEKLRLEQVMNNLLENALKYTPDGGVVAVESEVIPSAEGAAMVEVRVRDTGSGIPAADLPHIFERFYRADKARSRAMGGTGLGLSIVKHIVLLHGGSVNATSEMGVGTVISFRLPVG